MLHWSQTASLFIRLICWFPQPQWFLHADCWASGLIFSTDDVRRLWHYLCVSEARQVINSYLLRTKMRPSSYLLRKSKTGVPRQLNRGKTPHLNRALQYPGYCTDSYMERKWGFPQYLLRKIKVGVPQDLLLRSRKLCHPFICTYIQQYPEDNDYLISWRLPPRSRNTSIVKHWLTNHGSSSQIFLMRNISPGVSDGTNIVWDALPNSSYLYVDYQVVQMAGNLQLLFTYFSFLARFRGS